MSLRLLYIGLFFCFSSFASTTIDVQVEVDQQQSILASYETKLKEFCTNVKELSWGQGRVTCHSHILENDSDISIQISPEINQLTLTIINRTTEDANAAWNIQRGPTELDDAAQLITSYILSLRLKKPLEEIVLVNAIKSSDVLKINESGDYVELKSGEVVKFEEARQIYISTGKKERFFWKAFVNMWFVLGIRGMHQFKNKDFWRIDPEYEHTWKDIRTRIYSSDAHALDADKFNVNALRDPLMNMAIHLGARSVGGSFAESFLMSFAGSLIWETFGEYKDKISINDVFIQPFTGAVLGEVIHRMTDFLWNSQGSDRKVLSLLMNPIGGFKKIFSSKVRDSSAEYDSLGFDASVFHNFEMHFGATTDQTTYLKFNSQIYHLKNYLEATKRAKDFGAGDLTLSEIEGLIGKDGIEGFRLFVQTSLVGLHKQAITQTPGEEKSGYSVLVGLSSNYEYSQLQYDKFNDKLGVLNVLGTTVEFHYFHKGFHISTTLDVHGNVSQIKSASLDKLEATRYDLQQTKYVLETQRYYFAYGMNIQARATIQYKYFFVEAKFRYLKAKSINGLDRYQYVVADDFTDNDSRLFFETTANYRFLNRFLATAGYQYYQAQGSTKEVSDEHRRHFYFGRMGIQF